MKRGFYNSFVSSFSRSLVVFSLQPQPHHSFPLSPTLFCCGAEEEEEGTALFCNSNRFPDFLIFEKKERRVFFPYTF